MKNLQFFLLVSRTSSSSIPRAPVEIVCSNNCRIDDLVSQVADLRTSLQFGQNDIAENKTMIEMIDVKVQSAANEIKTIHCCSNSICQRK